MAADGTPDPTRDGAPAERTGLHKASGYAQSLATLVLLAGVALAVAGVALVINQLTQPGADIMVTVSDPELLVAPRTSEALPQGTALDLSGSLETVRLHVAELPAPHRALTEAPMLFAGVLALVGALLLRRVLLEIAAGRPFAPVVPRRLAGLSLVVLAAALLPQALATLATIVVLEHVGYDGATSPIGFTIFSVELLSLLLAAGLGIAASVFHHGQRLTEDVDGLV